MTLNFNFHSFSTVTQKWIEICYDTFFSVLRDIFNNWDDFIVASLVILFNLEITGFLFSIFIQTKIFSDFIYRFVLLKKSGEFSDGQLDDNRTSFRNPTHFHMESLTDVAQNLTDSFTTFVLIVKKINNSTN